MLNLTFLYKKKKWYSLFLFFFKQIFEVLYHFLRNFSNDVST